MNATVILGIASAVGLSHSLFLSIYLFLNKTQNRAADLWLSLLILALATRISKSVFFTIFGETPMLYIKSALIGMALIGPFLFLYLRTISTEQRQLNRTAYLHFLPALLVSINLFTDHIPLLRISYLAVIAHIAIYILIAAWKYAGVDRPHLKNWIWTLMVSVTLIWVIFVLQYIRVGTFSYIVISIIAAFILFAASLMASLKFDLLKKVHAAGFKKLPLSRTEARNLANSVQSLFESEGIYRDSELTLPKLARRLKVPPHHLSAVINRGFSKSFPELLNHYRVEWVKNELLKQHNNHKKIESIAYDAGFQSPSHFYTSFKKLCNMTPGQYRKTMKTKA